MRGDCRLGKQCSNRLERQRNDCKGNEESKMKINCLSCGHTVGLDDAYDDYEGQVKCYACSAMLEIKTAEGNVKAAVLMRGLVGSPSTPPAAPT